jgi:hypothetical protein
MATIRKLLHTHSKLIRLHLTPAIPAESLNPDSN